MLPVSSDTSLSFTRARRSLALAYTQQHYHAKTACPVILPVCPWSSEGPEVSHRGFTDVSHDLLLKTGVHTVHS